MTSDEFGDIEQLDENLRKWFKEKWVRFGPDGKIRGACARGSSKEGKPKCLPQSKAHSIGKKGRKYAASKKRREDPNPERRGPAKNVATKKKTNEEKCPHCGGELVSEELMNEKKDACYRKVKARYKVWPSAYASGALVQCRKKGAANWGNKSKANEAAGDTLMDPEYALPQARKITKAIKYDDTVGEIITQIEMLAERTQGIDSRTIQYAIDGVLAAKNALEYAVYDLEEAFEDAAREMQYKRDEEELDEDETMQFAAEKTPAINPYGGQKDRQFRGAIGEAVLSEMPDTSGPVGVQPGGWRRTDNPGVEEGQIYSTGGGAGEAQRKFRPKSAGTFKEDELDEACWKGYHKEGNKKMFGKTYPNCVKNTNEEQLDEKCWDSHKQVGMKKKGDKMVPNCVPKESAIMKGLKR